MATESEELVILLDGQHRPIGTMAKAQVHTANTPLHLAFSVYAFDAGGRFLATRRALSKLTWAGVWTNSCCGHPGPDEAVADAAHRRLREELGLTALSMELALPTFRYRATSAEGVVENEVCPVFIALVAGDPTPDPNEVADWRWVDWAGFRAAAQNAPWALSPWAVAQVAELPVSVVSADRVPDSSERRLDLSDAHRAEVEDAGSQDSIGSR